jgi:hypothetical protein
MDPNPNEETPVETLESNAANAWLDGFNAGWKAAAETVMKILNDSKEHQNES